jgi:hypothetical protein
MRWPPITMFPKKKNFIKTDAEVERQNAQT